jgi:hypothetical protein
MRGSWKRLATVVAVTATVISGVVGFSLPAGSTPTTGAAFTTVNEAVDGAGHCQNGNPNVNCNIYDGKQFVWMNGGPLAASVGDGTYFFAVLDPGGQADPNDNAPKNLSDDFDLYTDRTFSVSGGTISYSGPHDFADNKIRLADYADTTNPGGVYIMAICSLANGYEVDPSSCKYDAFKVQAGDVEHGKPLTVTKDANGSYSNTYSWNIAKDVDKTLVNQAPGSATFNYTVAVGHDAGTISNVKVTGTITVTNPNVDSSNDPVAVAGVNVTDQLSDGTVCSVTGGTGATLTAFKTDFAYSCDLSALPQGQLDNTATVTWADQFLDNGAVLDSGTGNFKFSEIAFTGTSVDECVTVTDSYAGTLGSACVGDANPQAFTYARQASGATGTCTSYDNTATFTTNATGATGTASKTVKVCVGADLTVAKTALPTFTRTYKWAISKDVDKTVVKQIGGSATFNYTVNAGETGFTDSGWAVSGKITVSNPNDWEAITADLSDAIDNGGSCSVTGGTAVSVAASSSVTRDYTCSYAAAPSPSSGTNTATATWDPTAANTTSGSANGTAAANFVAPSSTVNKTVAIVDSYKGTLGTLTATDSAPFASASYKYSRTIAVPANGCLSYGNTATITETGQYASKSVKVCGPAKTGALTMGYWQNKNGQAIVTGGAAVSGVCKSGTFLRGYAPFQDLSATATCAQVGTYVTNVIKSANASGAAMNAMLKAQMLSTALDVYFSDAALGGNKISAPAPVGGVSIDLTQICKMIDATSGTATCSGTFENTSSSFGGATSLTVSQMLAYAASQSNAGGGTWYANVKATQGLAKDAFDAINNAAAFAS